MSPPAPNHATLDDWIACDAIPYSMDSPATFHSAVDQMIATLGDAMELLGFGEALHGGEDILVHRNLLFERLVTAHGYSAIAIESSFPRAKLVNEYISGRGLESYEAVQDRGFSHGFGRLGATRELIDWMRQYNSNPAHAVKLQFYGFDSPNEMMGSDSPRHLLYFVLDYLAAIDPAAAQSYRERIDPLIGEDSAWENPGATFDPTKAIGLSPAATALRIETEDLITGLTLRRPELVAKSDARLYGEAAHYASLARQFLNYHAELARTWKQRIARGLGIRDAIMADNLAYAVMRERGRGKVLAFAHNCHLKCGMARWQLGPDLIEWWPAGALLREMLGPRYAVIGTAVGVSDANGIGQPEAGTLEARLIAAPGPARFIATGKGQTLPASAIDALPTRAGSMRNQSYFPLTPQSFTEFDCLLALDSTTYNRGGPKI